MDTNTVSILIQGGAVGIALVLVFLLKLAFQLLYKISTNHMAHTDAYMQEHTKSNMELSLAIHSLQQFIRDSMKKE